MDKSQVELKVIYSGMIYVWPRHSGFLEQESTAAAEPPLSSCNSSASGWEIIVAVLMVQTMSAAASYSDWKEGLVQNKMYDFINLTSTGNYLLEIRWCCDCQFRPCTHLCFSKRDQGSTFKWLIISISSFSNPSISGCHSFSPNAVCYEYFHISQGKSINYPLFFIPHICQVHHKVAFPGFFLVVGACHDLWERMLGYLADVWWMILNDSSSRHVSHVEKIQTPCFKPGEETVCPVSWLVESTDLEVEREHAFAPMSQSNCGVCGKVQNLQRISWKEGKKWPPSPQLPPSSSGLAVG